MGVRNRVDNGIMPLDQKAILQQIDEVLHHVTILTGNKLHGEISDQNGTEAATVLRSAIERLAPPESSYVKNIGKCTIYGGPQGLRQSIRPLIGILNALRVAYASSYFRL
jgi:hypothetical protein